MAAEQQRIAQSTTSQHEVFGSCHTQMIHSVISKVSSVENIANELIDQLVKILFLKTIATIDT